MSVAVTESRSAETLSVEIWIDINLLFFFVCAGPTMKLRRPIVVKMYQEKINEMYAVATEKQ